MWGYGENPPKLFNTEQQPVLDWMGHRCKCIKDDKMTRRSWGARIA